MVMAVSLLLLIVGSSAERDFEVTLDDITRNQQRNFDGGFHPGGDGAKAQKAAGSFFEGNISSSQHFALLSAQPGSLLVGGRGVVYNLSLPGLHEIREEVSRSIKLASTNFSIDQQPKICVCKRIRGPLQRRVAGCILAGFGLSV